MIKQLPIGQRASIYGLLMLGLSTEKIALILGFSNPIVRREVLPDWMPVARGRKSQNEKPPRKKRVDYQAVMAMHDDGQKTLREVGEHFGVTRERVRQILMRHGVDVRLGKSQPVAVYSDRLQRYYAALKPGVTTLEAAAEIGLTYPEIQAAGRALGVTLPRPVRKSRNKYQEIATFYEAHPHATGSDVARHFDISPNTVSKALRVMGIAIRQKGWAWKRPKIEDWEAA